VCSRYAGPRALLYPEGTRLDLERNIRKLRKVDPSVQDLVSQQESLAAPWITNVFKR
jgi:hypothetical protein